jgi:hypothetical protein
MIERICPSVSLALLRGGNGSVSAVEGRAQRVVFEVSGVLSNPLTPCFEIVCTTLVCNRTERANFYFLVLGNVNIAYFSRLGMFVAESNVAPFARHGSVAETSEYFHDVSTGERLPDHSLLEEFRQLVLLLKCFDINVQFLVEELVRIVDRFAAASVESKHLGQVCQCLGTSLSASGETSFEIAGRHAPIVFVDELHTVLLSVA